MRRAATSDIFAARILPFPGGCGRGQRIPGPARGRRRPGPGVGRCGARVVGVPDRNGVIPSPGARSTPRFAPRRRARSSPTTSGRVQRHELPGGERRRPGGHHGSFGVPTRSSSASSSRPARPRRRFRRPPPAGLARLLRRRRDRNAARPIRGPGRGPRQRARHALGPLRHRTTRAAGNCPRSSRATGTSARSGSSSVRRIMERENAARSTSWPSSDPSCTGRSSSRPGRPGRSRFADVGHEPPHLRTSSARTSVHVPPTAVHRGRARGTGHDRDDPDRALTLRLLDGRRLRRVDVAGRPAHRAHSSGSDPGGAPFSYAAAAPARSPTAPSACPRFSCTIAMSARRATAFR